MHERIIQTLKVYDSQRFRRLAPLRQAEFIRSRIMQGLVFLIGPTYTREKYQKEYDAVTAACKEFFNV